MAFACTGNVSETTQDIDAIFDLAEQRFDAASFIPGVSKAVVVETALGKAYEMFETVDTSTLETSATVNLYTGKDNRGQQVEEVKV